MAIEFICMTAWAFSASSAIPEEQLAVRQWTAAHFEGALPTGPPNPGIEILQAHDLVQKNSHQGKSLRISDVTYDRGLYCHAPTKLLVRLPVPAAAFKAIVGIDNNPQTNYGASSVEFIVTANGAEAFKSDVRRVASPPLPIEVALNGAMEVTLELTDAGDGIHSDQAIWADAAFTMVDGSILWLDDLAMLPGLATLDTKAPFSFTYGGVPSADFLDKWSLTRASEPLDDARVRRRLTYTDPATGLEVRCEGIEYLGYPVIEWTVYLRNTGDVDTPRIEALRGLDITLERHLLLPEYEFILNHNNGTIVTTENVPAGQRDFEPLRTPLKPSEVLEQIPPQGRPTAGYWPYYNIESMGRGLIAVIGWPGQWVARFERDAAAGLRLQAGQATTSFILRAGEEVRTPLIVLQFWSGERVDSQNEWRRWMLAYNVPKPGGKPLEPYSGAFDGYYFPELQITDAGEKEYMARYVEEELIPDFWWVDAGWYPCEGSWVNTGTWEADATRFPGGLKSVLDKAREHGMKGIVWFEPERVTPGSRLYTEHPEWMLPAAPGEGTRLFDLGNPEARAWLTDHISGMLTEAGITIYRQDFNMDPLAHWRFHDTPDRQGMTEMRYVEGYLAFWDELLRRHPSLIIDTCASGAHRDDLETLRRSVPLWRSDFAWDPTGMQCQTYGLASWVPYFGTGAVSGETYDIRSVMTPFFLMSWDMRRKDLDFDLIRDLMKEWRTIAPYYLGDFYPLTPYSIGDDVWMAWQFNRPDLKGGAVQVFRRGNSIYESAHIKLRGLDPEAFYWVTDMNDACVSSCAKGDDLMEEGLPIKVKDSPGALTIHYYVY